MELIRNPLSFCLKKEKTKPIHAPARLNTEANEMGNQLTKRSTQEQISCLRNMQHKNCGLENK